MLIKEEYKAYLILKIECICVTPNNPQEDCLPALQCDGFLSAMRVLLLSRVSCRRLQVGLWAVPAPTGADTRAHRGEPGKQR